MQYVRRILVALLAAAMLGGSVSGGTSAACMMMSDGAAAPCDCPGCGDEDQPQGPCVNANCSGSWTLGRPACLAGEALPRRAAIGMRPTLPPDEAWATLIEPPDPPPPR